MHQVRSEVGDVAPILAETIRKLQNSPLDENPGEEWHRRTNLTLQRAASTRKPWLLGSTREQQNLNRHKAFLATVNPLAKKVVRFEWSNFKRVLRPSIYRRWVPVKLKDQKKSRSSTG